MPTALAHQSDAYLREPIDPETLVATARALIRAREAERRQAEAEERARTAERRAAQVLESIADPVIAFDSSRCATYVSAGAAQALGRPVDEIVGLSLRDALFDQDGALIEACEQSIRQSAPVTLERYSPASGQWSELYIYPAGNCVSIQWRDITQRKRSEEALRESQEQASHQLAEIRALYQSAPVGLSVFDDQLRWVRLNRRIADLTGLPPEQHIAKKPSEVLPGLGEQIEAALRRVLATGEALTGVELNGETPAQPGRVTKLDRALYPAEGCARTGGRDQCGW